MQQFWLVARTGLLLIAVTAPLWAPPLWLGQRVFATQNEVLHIALAIVITALGGAMAMLAALLSYASLRQLSVLAGVPLDVV